MRIQISTHQRRSGQWIFKTITERPNGFYVRGKCYRPTLDDLYDSIIRSGHIIVNEKPDILILIYCEEDEPAYEVLPDVERKAVSENPNVVIYNATETGNLIKDKMRTNLLLSQHAPFPKIIKNNVKHKVFVNDLIGCQKEVIISDGDIEEGKYNTRFIETLAEYNGNEYRLAIRAHVVTTPKQSMVTDMWMRFRSATESPSVHCHDAVAIAQHSPEVKNYFTGQYLSKYYYKAITAACGACGRLGCGFYAVDMLPGIDGDVYICEIGFKFAEKEDVQKTYNLKPQRIINAFIAAGLS